MSNDGFTVSDSAMGAFENHLNTLRDNLNGTAGQVGGCVADVGMFGLVGQLFAAGASMHCAQARDSFTAYAGTVGELAGKVKDATKAYNAGDQDAFDSFSSFTEVGT